MPIVADKDGYLWQQNDYGPGWIAVANEGGGHARATNPMSGTPNIATDLSGPVRARDAIGQPISINGQPGYEVGPSIGIDPGLRFLGSGTTVSIGQLAVVGLVVLAASFALIAVFSGLAAHTASDFCTALKGLAGVPICR